MLRYAVAFVCVCLGGVVAALDVAVATSALPPEQRGIPGHTSPAESRLIFEACVSFYGIVYTVGRLLYRWLGAAAEREQLQTWSRQHMAVLNAFGGLWLITSGTWTLVHAPVFRPSLIVGLMLTGLAARDGWNALRPPSVH